MSIPGFLCEEVLGKTPTDRGQERSQLHRSPPAGPLALASFRRSPPSLASPKQQQARVRGPTRDLYFPRRSDPLQQRGRTAQTEEVVPDEGARPASEPPSGNQEVDLTTAGGTAQDTDLRSARRVRTPPSRRVREEAGFEELRLRSAALASFRNAGDLEPEVVQQQAPGAEGTEDVEVEVEAEADDGGAASPAGRRASPRRPRAGRHRGRRGARGGRRTRGPTGRLRGRRLPGNLRGSSANVGARRGRGITSPPLILAPGTETFPTVRVDSQGAWVRVREPEAVPSFTRRVVPPRGCRAPLTPSVHQIRLICPTTPGSIHTLTSRGIQLGVFL